MSQEEEFATQDVAAVPSHEYGQDDDRGTAVEMNIGIPRECPECEFLNFYIWGTMIGGRLYIEMRCMRCGTKVLQVKNVT
jgi:hypothetical protein